MKKQPDGCACTACRDLPRSLEHWRYFEVIYTHLFHVVPAHNPFLPFLWSQDEARQPQTKKEEEMSTNTDGIKLKKHQL